MKQRWMETKPRQNLWNTRSVCAMRSVLHNDSKLPGQAVHRYQELVGVFINTDIRARDIVEFRWSVTHDTFIVNVPSLKKSVAWEPVFLPTCRTTY
jgi:hypothetical protein